LTRYYDPQLGLPVDGLPAQFTETFDVLEEIIDPEPPVEATTAPQCPSIAVSSLIEALRDPRVEIRHAAVDQLLDHEEQAEIHARLTALLHEVDLQLRKTAIDALRRLHEHGNLPMSDETLQAALAALKDVSAEVRQDAAHLLVRCGSACCVEPLLAALHDSDWAVRCEAMLIVKHLARNDAVALLETLAEDDDERVRRAAVSLLRRARGVSEALESDVLVEEEEASLPELHPCPICHGACKVTCFLCEGVWQKHACVCSRGLIDCLWCRGLGYE
jgi:hypothetical protein